MADMHYKYKGKSGNMATPAPALPGRALQKSASEIKAAADAYAASQAAANAQNAQTHRESVMSPANANPPQAYVERKGNV